MKALRTSVITGVIFGAFMSLSVLAQEDASKPEAAGDAAPTATEEAAQPTEAQPAADGEAAAESAPAESGAEGDTAPAAAGSDAAPSNEAGNGTAEPAPSGNAVNVDDLQTGDEEYDIRIRGLESKVNELKEQIFRSKAKLELLTEAVTEGGLGQGAMAVIVHRNEMGSNIILKEVNYFLDGAPIWQESDENDPGLNSKRNHVVWDGALVEGAHTLSVQMRFQGEAAVFSYLEGYTFNLRDTHTFTTEPGKVITLESVAYEQGNFTTEFTDRPRLKFRSDLKTNEGSGN